jgi:hypothetical protein
MRLTLDGLLRSLRSEAHRLAEEAEQGYFIERASGRPDQRSDETTRSDDDRPRR